MPKTKHKPGIHLESHPTIDQTNRAIAIFMGLIPVPAGTIRLGDIKYPEVSEPFLQYHSSWDWLMPVWKKAGEILYGIRGDLSDKKYIEAHKITKAFMDACQKVEVDQAHEAVYNAVQFIQWYNKQKDNE